MELMVLNDLWDIMMKLASFRFIFFIKIYPFCGGTQTYVFTNHYTTVLTPRTLDSISPTSASSFLIIRQNVYKNKTTQFFWSFYVFATLVKTNLSSIF